MTYRELLRRGSVRLEEAGIEEASLDAWYLLEEVSGLSRARYYLEQNREAPEEIAAQYKDKLEMRSGRIPLQHILGTAEFMGLTFFVNEHVLIPRQDTETLVELALTEVKNRGGCVRVLDMCTGSGCIAISLAVLGQKYCPEGLHVTAADLSRDALSVAVKNAEQHQVQIQFFQSDLFSAMAGERFDVIVSNPPYIPTGVISGLMPEVREHDPRMALDGGTDGLDFYRRLAKEGRKHLRASGYVMFEIGHDQAGDVSRILAENGYHEIQVHRDLTGLDRVVCAII